MSFSAPQWWWALLALAVPLVIHLLSRGRRQRIAIGTVRHLTGAESRALSRLRLTNWPLMLLRMVALAALAIALVGLRSPRDGRMKGGGGWVLIDPELAETGRLKAQIPPGFSSRLETSIAEARSVRVLTRGLPETSVDEGSVDGQVDVWSLLREADSIAPEGIPFSVFSFDRVELLRGKRPHLARPVEWHVIEDTEPNQWLERIERNSEGDLVAIIGESSNPGTRFRSETWQATESPAPDSDLLGESDPEMIRLSPNDRFPEDNSLPVPLVAPPLRVALAVSETRLEDAWYVRQAVETVGRYMGRPVRWVGTEGETADLSIGLGDPAIEPLSASVILLDHEVADEPCRGKAYNPSDLSQRRIRLSRCATDRSPDAGAAWWMDSWGRPYISRLPDASASVYRLHGRFNPGWSNLASTVALPRLLLSILDEVPVRAGGVSNPRSDRRGTTGSERTPGRLESKVESEANRSVIPELLTWLLVAMLLMIERLYSRRAT